MLQIQVFSTSSAGRVIAASRFPFRIGRAANADLRLEEAGVWDDHATIRLSKELILTLESTGSALVTQDGLATPSVVLRGANTIGIGAATLFISTTRPIQPGQRTTEVLTWSLVAVAFLVQCWLLYRVL